MNLLFLEVFAFSGTFFTDPFQDGLIVSEIANDSRKPIYQDPDQDLDMLGGLGQAIQTIWAIMFEATNVESPTHHEKLNVALKTVVKRNRPYTNRERGMKSILLYSIHLLKRYCVHKLVWKCNWNIVHYLKLVLVTIQDMLIVTEDDCGNIRK